MPALWILNREYEVKHGPFALSTRLIQALLWEDAGAIGKCMLDDRQGLQERRKFFCSR